MQFLFCIRTVELRVEIIVCRLFLLTFACDANFLLTYYFVAEIPKVKRRIEYDEDFFQPVSPKQADNEEKNVEFLAHLRDFQVTLHIMFDSIRSIIGGFFVSD